MRLVFAPYRDLCVSSSPGTAPSAETAPFPGLVEASAASSSPFKRVACDGEMNDFKTTQPSVLRAFATSEAAGF